MPKKKPEKSLDELLEEALVKEDEQPYVVPGNWVWVKFDTSLTNATSAQKKLKQKKYLEIGNIAVVDQGARLIGGYTNQKDLRYDGELPVIIFGDHTRIVKFIDFVFVQGADGVKVLLPRQIFVPEFIYYFLKNLYIPSMGYRRHFKFLRDASFSLPPLLEQKRIVKKLSSMLGKLKEVRELIQEARDTFEERRAAILNKAFTGELTKKWRDENSDVESAEKLIEILIDQKNKQGKKGKISTYEEMIVEDGAQPYNLQGSWEWVKIGYLLCEVAKKDPKREGIKKFTYLDISSIDNKAGRITDPKTYKGVEAPSRARQIVKTNDILFSTVRTYLKNIAVVDEIYNDQIASTGFCVMRCCGIINSRLLFRFVSSDVFIDRLNGFQRGISYPAVKTSDLLDQPIPLPPFSEQKEIIRILEELLDHEDEARALIDMEEHIDLLEKSILSKAFRGELGTNDTNDEPAIELLKRSLKEKMDK